MWGECHIVTRGDGLRERTGRVRQRPPALNRAKRPGEVSKQGGRTIQWMVRLTAFAILWGRKRAAPAQPKYSRSAEAGPNRPALRQRSRTKRRFHRDRRVRRKWRSILAPGPAQSSLVRARWEQRAFWGAPFEVPLRPGARKGVPVNHPPDGSLPLFAHLFRGNAPRSLSRRVALPPCTPYRLL